MQSDAQIARHAKAAGFQDFDLQIAVAVALAESGGNERAHNSTPPDNSYGLWQINMLGAMGPERRRQFGIKSNDELFDPAVNAKAAYDVYKRAGNKWRPWSTYTNDTYLRYMERAKAAVEAPTPAPSPSAYVLRRFLQYWKPMQRGDDVIRVQRKVNVDDDGIFGPLTRNAVMLWQRRHNLVADGVVGPKTAKSFGWRFDDGQ